jgi:hypothetical protein
MKYVILWTTSGLCTTGNPLYTPNWGFFGSSIYCGFTMLSGTVYAGLTLCFP